MPGAVLGPEKYIPCYRIGKSRGRITNTGWQGPRRPLRCATRKVLPSVGAVFPCWEDFTILPSVMFQRGSVGVESQNSASECSCQHFPQGQTLPRPIQIGPNACPSDGQLGDPLPQAQMPIPVVANWETLSHRFLGSSGIHALGVKAIYPMNAWLATPVPRCCQVDGLPWLLLGSGGRAHSCFLGKYLHLNSFTCRMDQWSALGLSGNAVWQRLGLALCQLQGDE